MKDKWKRYRKGIKPLSDRFMLYVSEIKPPEDVRGFVFDILSAWRFDKGNTKEKLWIKFV